MPDLSYWKDRPDKDRRQWFVDNMPEKKDHALPVGWWAGLSVKRMQKAYDWPELESKEDLWAFYFTFNPQWIQCNLEGTLEGSTLNNAAKKAHVPQLAEGQDRDS